MSEKNSAVCVCFSVRRLPVAPPKFFTSLYSRAYLADVSAGGGRGRNWSASLSTSGFSSAIQVVENGANGTDCSASRTPHTGADGFGELERSVPAVVGAQVDDAMRGALAEPHTGPFRCPVRRAGQGGREGGIETRPRRGEVVQQEVVRRAGGGSLGRRPGRTVCVPPVRPILSGDADDSVVHRCVGKREVHVRFGGRPGRVGDKGGDGGRVPVGDDRGVRGPRRREGCRRRDRGAVVRRRCCRPDACPRPRPARSQARKSRGRSHGLPSPAGGATWPADHVYSCARPSLRQPAAASKGW